MNAPVGKHSLKRNISGSILSFYPTEGKSGTVIIAEAENLNIKPGSVSLATGVFIAKEDGSSHRAEAIAMNAAYTTLSITVPAGLYDGEHYRLLITLHQMGSEGNNYEFESNTYFLVNSGVSYPTITGISPNLITREAIKRRSMLTLTGMHLGPLMEGGQVWLTPGNFRMYMVGGGASGIKVAIQNITLPAVGSYRINAKMGDGSKVICNVFLRVSE